jgi:hypothetical protein
MKSTTSRKGQTSITHLMNFSLPPRPHYNPSQNRSSRRTPTWGAGSGYHAGDKTRYVRANYRFIVNPKYSYHAQAANADVHLDWSSVLQILASTQTQATNCPICLSIPVAPRMAKCGHIFCFPCLIRFMHSTDDELHLPEKKARWKKCPICWDTIYISDVRPVRWFTGQQGELPMEGGDVVLRLLKRQPGSTLALPRDGAEDLDPEDDIPWYHAAEVADYARIMKGGEHYMIEQFDAEVEDLKRQEHEDEIMFGDDTTWTRKAISSIVEAKEKARGIGNPPDVSRTEKKPIRDPVVFQSPIDGVPEMYAYQHAVRSGQVSSSESIHRSIPNGPQHTAVTADEATASMSLLRLDKSTSHPREPKSLVASRMLDHIKKSSSHGDQPYYFYQALPHFYLSALDIRILKVAFGDFSAFPSTILPRVERISTGHVVDDDLRKRAKYLSHLPYGCEVSFLECDWTDSVLPEILGRFQLDIEKRRKRNREKELREEKERVRAEREEDEKRWAANRRKRPSYSAEERPFSELDFVPLSGSVDTRPSENDFAILEQNATSMGPPSPSRMQSDFGAPDSPSTSPLAARTVWGTAAVVPSSPAAAANKLPRNDGWLRSWEDGITGPGNELLLQSPPHSSTPVATSGKKKKNKKITLMSTSIQRGA